MVMKNVYYISIESSWIQQFEKCYDKKGSRWITQIVGAKEEWCCVKTVYQTRLVVHVGKRMLEGRVKGELDGIIYEVVRQ